VATEWWSAAAVTGAGKTLPADPITPSFLHISVHHFPVQIRLPPVFGFRSRTRDWLAHLLWHDGKFLGLSATVWEVIGWLGNAAFFSRFLVQWHATEKQKRVVVPTAFWWLSMAGSLLLLVYSISINKRVIIFAYAFTWIPYIRNLIIHHRHRDAHLICPQCQAVCPPHSNFCYACGAALKPPESKAARQKP
jgi:lipid-A-disaccharide synthase-like uncharacterized protein